MNENKIKLEIKRAGESIEFDEQWREVKVVPGYAVSSRGRVFILPRTCEVVRGKSRYTAKYAGKMMTAFIGRDGCRVQLGSKLRGPRWAGTVARLMMLTFVGDPPDNDCLLEVVHLDNNNYNDRLDNLRWGTRGLGDRIRTAQRMIQIGLDGGTVADAARMTAISMHHSMELSHLLRSAVGGRKGQPWPEVARMLSEAKPDLSDVLRSRAAAYRPAERDRRCGWKRRQRRET